MCSDLDKNLLGLFLAWYWFSLGLVGPGWFILVWLDRVGLALVWSWFVWIGLIWSWFGSVLASLVGWFLYGGLI